MPSERISLNAAQIAEVIAVALEGMAAELERQDQRVWTNTEVVEFFRKAAGDFVENSDKIEEALRG